MIELHDLVIARGARPITGRIGAGQIVGVRGEPGLVARLFEILAGERLPAGGTILGATRTRVHVRAGDEAPFGYDLEGALRAYATACGLDGARVREVAARAGQDPACYAVARGWIARPSLWLIAAPPGSLAQAAEDLLGAIADEVRGGSESLVWCGRARCDETWELADA